MTSFDASNLSTKKWRITRPLRHTLRRVSLALANFLRHNDHVDESSSPLIEANERYQLLTEIRTAIRLGLLDEAATGIASMGRSSLRDADCLNLLGVIDESRHAWKSARRWYGKAIRVDPTTFASTSISCGRRSNPMPHVRNTFSQKQALVTAFPLTSDGDLLMRSFQMVRIVVEPLSTRKLSKRIATIL